MSIAYLLDMIDSGLVISSFLCYKVRWQLHYKEENVGPETPPIENYWSTAC